MSIKIYLVFLTAILPISANADIWGVQTVTASATPTVTVTVSASPSVVISVSPSPYVSAEPSTSVSASASPSTTSEDSDSLMREEYQTAIDDAEDAKKANMISAGVWGVASVVCGANCVNYLGKMSQAKKTLQLAVTEYQGSANSAAAQCPTAAAGAAPSNGATTQMNAALTGDSAKEASAVPAKGAVSSLTTSGANEGMQGAEALSDDLGSDKALSSTMKAALQAVSSAHSQYVSALAQAAAAQTGATAGLGSGAGASCTSAIAPLNKSFAKITAAYADYESTSAAVISGGMWCSAATIASAATDYGLSYNMVGDTTESYTSLMAATPGVINTVVRLAGKSNFGHNTAGITSCLSTGLGITALAQKATLAMDYDELIQENTELRDQYSEAFFSGRRWRRTFVASLQAVDPVLNLIVGCAHASVPSQKYACKASLQNLSERTSCAKTRDPWVARAMSENPELISGLRSAFSELYSEAQLKKLESNPFDRDQLAQLLTTHNSELQPEIKRLLDQTFAQARTANPKPKAKLLGKSLVVPKGIPGTFSPEFFNREPAGISVKQNESIFEQVSRKYREVKNRVHALPWVTPFNKFSSGGQD